MGEGADRTRELADGYGVAGAAHPDDIPPELGMPQRELEAERHRLGMNAMGPADHGRAAMLVGTLPHRLRQPVEAGQDQIAGVAHLERLRGIDNVG